LGTARRIALDAVLPRRAPQRRRDLALALIVARLLEPAAKLATARMRSRYPPGSAQLGGKRSLAVVEPMAFVRPHYAQRDRHRRAHQSPQSPSGFLPPG
jgi:hypothetical protein